MRKQIRISVFETNSSSVHSLVISSDGREPSEFELNKNGEIEVDFGEFGKDEQLYYTQYDKLSYLITCLYYTSRGWDAENIYDSFEFKSIEKAVCKYTGASGIKILGKQEACIDHQSQPYGCIEIIDSYDEEAVIDFVFNKYISLRTDCD